MLISHRWLAELTGHRLSPEAVAETLTCAGISVEHLHPAAELPQKLLLVGEVLDRRNTTYRVSVGGKQARTIISNAPPLDPGSKVAVALPGCRLGERTIRIAKIGGQSSHGMLCSAAELGLGDEADRLLVLDDTAPAGRSLADYLGADDTLLELELTPNRGDCLSVRGVARELAALLGRPLKLPPSPRLSARHKKTLPIRLRAPALCPRYVGRVLTDLDPNARTPDWMRERLRRAGHSLLGLFVDVTNYVMLETGQPMHAFDFAKLSGGIEVRKARKGERLRLLNGQLCRLSDELVIADKRGPVALAGIMGGAASAVGPKTRHLYLEAAYFSPAAVRGRMRALHLQTDAGYRFERGVDYTGQVAAVERATELLMELAGGEPGPVGDVVVRSALPARPTIHLPHGELPRVLGRDYRADQVDQLFGRLGMQVKRDAKGWRVHPPCWRFDLAGAHDLVEEVARCFGYDGIEPVLPRAEALPEPPSVESERTVLALKRHLAAAGMREVITYSFIDPDLQTRVLGPGPSVRLQNPIAEQLSVMRRSLLPGLLGVLRTNQDKKRGAGRLFEVGRVFQPCAAVSETLPSGETVRTRHREKNCIAGLISGVSAPRQWGRAERRIDFYDIKGVVEQVLRSADLSPDWRPGDHPALHPGQAAALYQGKQLFGQVGRLHPARERQLELDSPVFWFELDLAPLLKRRPASMDALHDYPPVLRDLAVLVEDKVTAGRVVQQIHLSGGDWLEEVVLFDVHRGAPLPPGRKSLALGLTFRSRERSLTAAEIERQMERVLANLRKDCGAELRT